MSNKLVKTAKNIASNYKRKVVDISVAEIIRQKGRIYQLYAMRLEQKLKEEYKIKEKDLEKVWNECLKQEEDERKHGKSANIAEK